jgi:hypothetical protein
VSWHCDAGAAFERCWPRAREAGMAGTGGGLLEAVALVAAEDLGARAAGGDPGRQEREGAARWDLSFSGGRLYGLSETSGSAARVRARSRSAAVAVELSRFGSGLYAEHAATILVARPVAADLWGAVRVRGLGIAADGVPGRWSVASDVALAWRLLGRLSLGVAYENLGRSKIGRSPVASSASAGAALTLDPLTLAVSVTAEPGFTSSVAVGCDAALSSWLRLRSGIATEPGRFAVGLGFGDVTSAERPRRPAVDVAWEWHPQLGVSTFVTVSYRL